MATKRKGKTTGGRQPGESKTSPRRLAARDRALQAVDLRKKGLAFEAIARQLGYCSRQAAHKAVTELLHETAGEECDELRKLELMRLDALWEKYFQRATSGRSAPAARICLSISDRRARLMGLDAAAKVDATVHGTVSGGVLVTPGIMDPTAWAKAAEAQQVQLAEAEKQFVKAA